MKKRIMYAVMALLLFVGIFRGYTADVQAASIDIDLDYDIEAYFYTIDTEPGCIKIYMNYPKILNQITDFKNLGGDISEYLDSPYTDVDFIVESDVSFGGSNNWSYDEDTWNYYAPWNLTPEPLYFTVATIEAQKEGNIVILDSYEGDREIFDGYYTYSSGTSLLGNDYQTYEFDFSKDVPYMRARLICVAYYDDTYDIIAWSPWSEPRQINDLNDVDYEDYSSDPVISNPRHVGYNDNPYNSDASDYIALDLSTSEALAEIDKYYDLKQGLTIENDVYYTIDGGEELYTYLYPGVYAPANGTVFLSDTDIDFSTDHEITLYAIYYVSDGNGDIPVYFYSNTLTFNVGPSYKTTITPSFGDTEVSSGGWNFNFDDLGDDSDDSNEESNVLEIFTEEASAETESNPVIAVIGVLCCVLAALAVIVVIVIIIVSSNKKKKNQVGTTAAPYAQPQQPVQNYNQPVQGGYAQPQQPVQDYNQPVQGSYGQPQQPASQETVTPQVQDAAAQVNAQVAPKFCVNCGAPLTPGNPICPSCGRMISL